MVWIEFAAQGRLSSGTELPPGASTLAPTVLSGRMGKGILKMDKVSSRAEKLRRGAVEAA